MDKLTIKYNADLANGLGNLVSRVSKLCENSGFVVEKSNEYSLDGEFSRAIEELQFEAGIDYVTRLINNRNTQIDSQKLWEDTDKKFTVLADLVEGIREIAFYIRPFMPETASKIEGIFQGPKISASTPIFPRI